MDAPLPTFYLPIYINQVTIIHFFQIITTGHQRLQPLFDCLLTILCNVSPYIKSLSMMASCKLLHLLEAFSTPWFLFSNPSNHHLGQYNYYQFIHFFLKKVYFIFDFSPSSSENFFPIPNKNRNYSLPLFFSIFLVGNV